MKKLSGWARSRSLRRGSQGRTVDLKTSSENLAPPNGKAITPKDAPPVPQIPQDYRTGRILEESNVRPGSSNKMKPMLVGISRPSATYSRPGTSGSLQNAVTLAADKVAQLQKPSEEFERSHTRTMSPRSIDIFSVQNPKTSFTTYNEDVAERNLDTNVVAKEGKAQGYLRNSKYQEEVASRNAAPPIRSSMDSTRLSSSAGYRPNYAELRAYGLPKETEITGRLANDEDIRRRHEAEKAAQYEYRRRRQMLEEAVPPAELPASKTPPGLSGYDASPFSPADEAPPSATLQPVQSMPSAYELGAFEHRNESASGPRPASQRQQHRQSRILEPVYPVQDDDTAPSSLPGYQISRSELPQPREAETAPIATQSTSDRTRQPERASSVLSTTSSIKRTINLPNRTIMDLTGEDSEVFSDKHSETYSLSPVIGTARQDKLERARPSIVHSNSATERHSATSEDPNAKMAFEEGVANREFSQHAVRPVSPPTHSFSSITTLATSSPQAYQRRKPVSSVENSATIPSSETRKVVSNSLYTVAETEPEVGSNADLAPSPPVIKQGSEVSKRDFGNHVDAQSRPAVVQTPLLDPARTPTQLDFAQSPGSNVQQSPQSIQSSDFRHPSETFAVRTRDFAFTPDRTRSQPPPVARYEPDSAPKNKPKSTVRSRSTAPAVNGGLTTLPSVDEVGAKQKPSIDFNEDDFQRRKEQAYAALVRLQQSLNEDFAAPPREVKTTQARTNGGRRHANSSSSNDGRPYGTPPTSRFNQARPLQRPATAQAVSYADAQDKPQPRKAMSVHSQVTSERPPTSSSVARRPLPLNGEFRDYSDPKRSIKGKETETSRSNISQLHHLAQEMRTTKLTMPNTSQQRTWIDVSPSPRSPGEISLSSFPVPTPSPSRQTSQAYSQSASPPPQAYTHAQSQNPSVRSRSQAAPSPVIAPSPIPASPSMQQRQTLMRRNSNKSQTSVMTSTSQHSIPYHLIPDRGSSMRDSSVREEIEA